MRWNGRTAACIVLFAAIAAGCEDELSSTECMDYQDRWEALVRAERRGGPGEEDVVHNVRAIHGDQCRGGHVTREQFECVMSPITRTPDHAAQCTLIE